MAAVGGRTRAGRTRTLVLVLVMLWLLLPLLAAALYGFTLPGKGFTLESLRDVSQDMPFTPALWQSLKLAALSTAASLLLLPPTLIWLSLRAPRMLEVTEALSVIPMVVPAVALVSGVYIVFLKVAPGFLVSVWSLIPFYVVLSLPLVYRTLDAGVRALDLKLLMDAGASVGAGWWRSVATLVMPNMTTALLNAALLSFTTAFGEFALASLLLHNTFPVLINTIGQNNSRAAAALSFLVSIGTWMLLYLISLVGGRLGRKDAR